MTTILGAAVSGMAYNQNVLDTVANNLANVNTFGFKRSRAVAEGIPDAAATADTSRLGVAQTTTDLVFNPAAVQPTGNKLQFSIQDDTFLPVTDLDGSLAYTRLGALSADGVGNITAMGGRQLVPPVQIPAGMTAPAVDSAGIITAVDSKGATQTIGQVTLTRFTNPQGLEPMGSGLYRASANTGAATTGTPGSAGFAAIRPGTLEGSNVDTAEEFTNMIIAQRAYQAALKSFTVGDQMLTLATNLTQ